MEKASSEIFKMQRPLMTSSAEAQVLVYNEKGSITFFIDLTEELLGLFGDEFKIYVRGRIDEKGALGIEELVEWQDW